MRNSLKFWTTWKTMDPSRRSGWQKT